ncbi:MAG: hypothetical protein M3R55_06490 [Acidobacteriota bacterium]|nr:hypothetical protein [Acidobacteriota bacterium]
MDTATLVASLTTLTAIALTIVTVRLLRVDRQRSDARVAVLVSLAGQPQPLPSARASAMAFDAPPVKLQPRTPAARTVSAPHRQHVAKPAAADAPLLREPELFGATLRRAPLYAEAPVAAGGALFGPAVRTRVSPLVYIGAAAIIMAAVIGLSFKWAAASAAAPAGDTTTTLAAPAASAQPLSLVSLGHEQMPDGTLVISGVVRNPAGAIARERVFAAASLVDGGGQLVASARAPLDFTTLAAGEESPFVVRIVGANGVARYRIGFRDVTGASIAHLDRRTLRED